MSKINVQPFVSTLLASLLGLCANVASAAPTVSLRWEPAIVTHSGKSTLIWGSTGAVACQLNALPWSSSSGTLNGSWLGVNRTRSTTSTYQCKDARGNIISTTAKLSVLPKPAVSMRWEPAEVTRGGTSKLIWQSTNASECQINTQPWSNSSRTLKGDWIGVNRTSSTTSTYRCKDYNGDIVSTSAELIVHPKPTVSLRWEPENISYLETSTLIWNSSNATECKVNHLPWSGSAGTLNGSWKGTNRTSSTTSTFQCKDYNGDIISTTANLNVHQNPSISNIKVLSKDEQIVNTNNVDGLNQISHSSIRLDNSSTLTFELTLKDAPNASCQLNNKYSMASVGADVFKIDIQPAYLKETLTFGCDVPHTDGVSKQIQLIASDTAVQTQLAAYLSASLKTASIITDEDYIDPYDGYRITSYYAQIHNLLNRSYLYRHASDFNLTPTQKLALQDYLINTSEAFFEPCGNRSRTNAIPDTHQCRFSDKLNAEPYYRWSSPAQLPSNSPYYNLHWHYEWRAAGNIAQAVKAILLTNNQDLTCPAHNSDNPSDYKNLAEIKAMSPTNAATCRAENVRRLLAEQVWQKWSDNDYLANVMTTGYAIQNTPIPHFIARTKMIEDLFTATAFTSYDPFNVAGSRLYQITDTITANHSQQTVSIKCSPVSGAICNWRNKHEPFHETGSVDINHTVDTLVVINLTNSDNYCDSSGCVDKAYLANTLNSQAWNPEIARFDWFVNGYCINNHSNPSDAPIDTLTDEEKMRVFCAKYWNRPASEVSMLGWVEAAKYNRDLMIKIRSLPLQNTYIVPLYLTLLN
ncbi:hypothetical protein J8M20_09215 [Pseudoalteromonas luteoviolacea]|uniref:hypothetical protein n=1 Tax=Pseudoalteromonas luteoviolacea TaxID=43657 RepID=UPI001B389A79|nr:hypothetical protein [Pseudoalteromonas luteoviolacea]MBQ4811517.1 hypothetical protein [Pseudoalteromonas luteoviolacea]